MTRFARAKGSKSSNERAPEDSTPWEVMKDQLLQAKKETEDAKKREEAEKQRIENYENFLKEHKSQKRKATWCDFPETDGIKSKVSQKSEILAKKKKNNKQKAQKETVQPILTRTDSAEKISLNAEGKKSKKKQLKKELENIELHTLEIGIEQSKPTSEETTPINVTESLPKKKAKKKKQKKHKLEEVSQVSGVVDNDHNGQPQLSIQEKNKNKKKQKLLSDNNGPIGGENDDTVKHSSHVSKLNNIKQNKNKKGKKLVDGVPVRRKPIDNRSFQLIINGKEVELVRFDGFPIMKRDAERLDELKMNMIKKGIPKSEVNRTLKLERRRAEKALARLKRDVCYNCRKGGHNLSDCPELKTKIPGVGAPDGVCFKCGSTEHRQFECKVQKDKEFRFATCFICKEPGHIARQCPDNPKGLYPNGGGCKLCGDVTHLRKDCPTTMGSKEETSIKLQTLDSTDHLEGIEQRVNNTPQETIKKPKKIKF